MDLLWLASETSANGGNNTNWTDYQIMEERPNFEAMPQKYHIYIISLYSLTALAAISGNGITLRVFWPQRHKPISKYLINLALSDLLMAIFSIPFTYTMFMFGRWHFSPFLCPLVLGAQLCSLLVSVYTLLAIGFDRWIAIKKPIYSRTIKHSTNYTILAIWAFGFFFGFLSFQYTKVTEVQLRNETYCVCHEVFDGEQIKYASGILFLISFLLPVSFICYIYSSMSLAIIRSSNSIALVDNNDNFVVRKCQKRRIVRMMIVVVVAFLFCWLPLQVFNLVSVFFESVRQFNTEFELTLYVMTNFTFHWLAMAHSFVNPIIYSFMSANFKKQIRHQWSGNFRKFCSSIKSGRSLSRTMDNLEIS